jgi:hypothetical protein
VIEIDLNARVLTENHNAFIVRPGNGYGLYPEITQRGLLILELPGLDLTSGERPADDDLRRRINRSRALRSWYRGDQDGAKPTAHIDFAQAEVRITSAAVLLAAFDIWTRVLDLIQLSEERRENIGANCDHTLERLHRGGWGQLDGSRE